MLSTWNILGLSSCQNSEFCERQTQCSKKKNMVSVVQEVQTFFEKTLGASISSYYDNVFKRRNSLSRGFCGKCLTSTLKLTYNALHFQLPKDQGLY